jgi:3-oxoacyl-[acyl-carrier protein] reductase
MKRVAFVTGASGAIGAAVAERLAADGHAVAVGYAADREGAAQVVDAICGAGGSAHAVCVDVTEPKAVDAAFSEVEDRYGPVTTLVNTAGRTGDGLLVRMEADQWDDVLAVNLTGSYTTIRRAARSMMKAHHGRIVNVGSVVAALGSAGQANYAAAKAGLVGLTRSVAREFATRSVTCNLVEPGPIATPLTDVLPADRRTAMAQAVPAGRFGTADEVASAVAYLCTPEAAYVTGAILPVDGGLGMGR